MSQEFDLGSDVEFEEVDPPEQDDDMWTDELLRRLTAADMRNATVIAKSQRAAGKKPVQVLRRSPRFKMVWCPLTQGWRRADYDKLTPEAEETCKHKKAAKAKKN